MFSIAKTLPIRPLTLSIGIHFLILLFFFLMSISQNKKTVKTFSFTIEEKIKVIPNTKQPILDINKPKKKKIKSSKRKVYGLSRKSITSTKGIKVKKGNTVAKTPDKKLLKKDDVDSLPIPTDEFLISAMPKVLEEVRPIYPEDAKKEGLQGSVVLEILIDNKGTVRDAKVLKSLDLRFDKAALIAIKKFKFRPAMVDKSAVAVKIKYAIKFVLE